MSWALADITVTALCPHGVKQQDVPSPATRESFAARTATDSHRTHSHARQSPPAYVSVVLCGPQRWPYSSSHIRAHKHTVTRTRTRTLAYSISSELTQRHPPLGTCSVTHTLPHSLSHRHTRNPGHTATHRLTPAHVTFTQSHTVTSAHTCPQSRTESLTHNQRPSPRVTRTSHMSLHAHMCSCARSRSRSLIHDPIQPLGPRAPWTLASPLQPGV